jgi:bacillolysin
VVSILAKRIGALSMVLAVGIPSDGASFVSSSQADPVSTAAPGPMETFYDEDATPIYVRATLPRNVGGSAAGLAKQSVDERDRAHCLRFLESLALRFASNSPRNAFRILSMEREATRTHFRVRRLEDGIPVFDGDGRVVLKDEEGGDLDALYMGRYRPAPKPSSTSIPGLKADQARERAWKDLSQGSEMAPADPEMSGPPTELETRPELVWFAPEPTAGVAPGLPAPALRLAWHLAARPNFLELWEYLVDAQDGSILLKYPVHCSAGPFRATARDLAGADRTFGTYQHSDSRYYLIDAAQPMFDPARSRFPDQTVGAIVTMDMANSKPTSPVYRHLTTTDNVWRDPKAVSAHFNAFLSYDYFLKAHGRNSINGVGGTIRSYINVVDAAGLAMDNAYWNGNAMFYGNGRTLLTPLTEALDVGGHELTHGVIGATAALRYRGQSGAINESMADIFGVMIDRDDWTLGEDIVKTTYFPTGAMRSLANPNQGLAKTHMAWQPAHMNQYMNLPLTVEGDNGGVHINSGIPNHAFYKFAVEVGKEKAEQVYYRALTRYLGASSQFIDLRLAVTTAAKDLYGEAEVKAAENAFAAVGIGAPGPVVPKINALQVNPGPQSVLLTRAGRGDGNTLYVADSAFANAKPLTRTVLGSRPSVTDDGTQALFVSKDGRIIKIRTDPAAPTETVVDANPVWILAAISKDGKRWAATRKIVDTAIHIGDFSGGPVRKFPLYDPAGQGVRTAVEAGSLDWDHSGENVLYDVMHRMAGDDGSSLEFWDVGMLRVWDNDLNGFGDGQMHEPFGDLPDGSSAGNPVFAKNSPDIVVYEFIDAGGAWSIRARDIETRRSGLITSTTMVGFPSYDKHDAGVAYASRSGTDTVISWIPLAADKISPKGTAKVVATGFKWPVFFAKGTRKIVPTAARTLAQAALPALKAFGRHSSRTLTLEYVLPAAARVKLSLFGTDGRLQGTLNRNLGAGAHRTEWTPDGEGSPGLRFVRLEADGLVLRAKVLTGNR